MLQRQRDFTAGVTPLLPETLALAGRLTVKAGTRRVRLIDQTIRGLQAAALWDKFDGLWFLAAHSEEMACLNWRAPGTYTMTPTNAPAFAVDQGYTGNASNAFLDAGVEWGSLVRASQDSMHLAGWVRAGTDAAANVPLGGGTVSKPILRPRFTADVISANLNQTSATSLGASTTIVGHTMGTRRASNDIEAYRNGVSTGSASTASTAPTAGSNVVALRAVSVYCDFQLSIFHVGSGFTTAEAALLYPILAAYMNGL